MFMATSISVVQGQGFSFLKMLYLAYTSYRLAIPYQLSGIVYSVSQPSNESYSQQSLTGFLTPGQERRVSRS